MNRRRFLKNTTLFGVAFSLGQVIRAQTARSGRRRFIEVRPDPSFPRFAFLSIDGLGRGKLAADIMRVAVPPEPAAGDYVMAEADGGADYRWTGQAASTGPVWSVRHEERSFTVTSEHAPGHAQPFVLDFDQVANHATLLGRFGEPGKISLPAVLHFPDLGTLRVTASVPGVMLGYDARRGVPQPFVKVSLPAATAQIPAISYRFEIVQIHPAIPGIEDDPRYDAFRRDFISVFQLNPRVGMLANNSSSDPCALTLYLYAELAPYVPPLAPGLSALDLVRLTLDRYLTGSKGYGMVGYEYDNGPSGFKKFDSLDTYPSLLVSACLYALAAAEGEAWWRDNAVGLNAWVERLKHDDLDGDGILEYGWSGNSGSWPGDGTLRPANWWDTVGFGWKDAYSNAIAYRAYTLLERVHRRQGRLAEADLIRERAERLQQAYVAAFYNPVTGVLGGWRSEDGRLHDYYFVFVNTVAISYGLVEPALGHKIMDRLFAVMAEVGFHDFGLGLPGNLVPIRREDYTVHNHRWGGGQREDNRDGFQIYENGGATACFTYFAIKAALKLGRTADADRILLPLLQSMSEGNFQGRGPDGMTKDWKTWTGECWGYEGFLVDNYLYLLAVWERHHGLVA